MSIVVTMVKLFFAMALGFLLNKKGILDIETNKKLSSLIINVTCPMLIISSVASAEGTQGKDVVILLIAGAVTYLLLPFLSYAICKLIRVPKDCFGTYRCMLIFSNNSFMGFPVIEALFGPIAIFYSTIFHFGFNILFYSYGIFIIGKDAGETKKFESKNLVNVGMISGLIALFIYFSGIYLPEVIVSPLSFVGGITMPLSMMVIGSNMAGYEIKDLFAEKKIYIITFIRLVIMPLLAFWGMSMVTNQPLLIGIATVTLGMPVASMVAMGSSSFEKQGKVASLAVVMSTICSMITIPVMAMLLQ